MNQRGSITMYLIIGAIILTMIGLMGYQIKRLEEKNSSLTESLTAVTKERDDLIQKVDRLEKEVEAERALAEASKKQVDKYVEEVKTLQGRVKDLISKLPKVKPREASEVIDPEQETRSMKRISLLWEIYCLNNQLPGCVKEEKHEPDQKRTTWLSCGVSGWLSNDSSSCRQFGDASPLGTGPGLFEGLRRDFTAGTGSVCQDVNGRKGRCVNARSLVRDDSRSGMQLEQEESEGAFGQTKANYRHV